MARGSAASEGSGGDNVQHFSTIRVRATGQGYLRMVVFSLDQVKKKDLVPFELHALNRLIPNRLVNFVEQKASFELYTVDANEYVRINRIVVYMKEIYTSTPGA
jgi:hypothetical protein